MSLCDDWKNYFNAVLRFRRRVGAAPLAIPSEPIPEGCDLSPCSGSSSLMAQAITDFRTAVLAYEIGVGTTCGSPCGWSIVWGWFEVGSLGTLYGARVGCLSANPSDTCNSYSFFPVGDDPSCYVPDPPIPPLDEFSTPLLGSVTGGTFGDLQFSIPGAAVPNAAFYQVQADAVECICAAIRQGSGILFEVGNVLNGMLQVLGQTSMLRDDQQRNHIETMEMSAKLFGALYTVIQNTGADISGKSAIPMNLVQMSIRDVDEISGPTVVTVGVTPDGTCNQYSNVVEPCEANPYNV